MRTSILSALVLGTAVNAAAVAKRGADQTVWKSGEDGDTSVRFSDTRVSIGTCTPESIIERLYDECYDEGFCNASSFDMECIGDTEFTVTIEVKEGQYQTWIKNGLIEGLVAAITSKDVTETQDIQSMSGGGCVGCPWTSTAVTINKIPSTIGIAHANEGAPPDVINIEITTESFDGEGFCETVMGIGETVAGAVNGAAGGIFSLASIACALA